MNQLRLYFSDAAAWMGNHFRTAAAALRRWLGAAGVFVWAWLKTLSADTWRLVADPLNLLMSDPAHTLDGERYLLLGMSNRRRLLVVAFAERPPRARRISARRATRQERRQYEEER